MSRGAKAIFLNFNNSDEKTSAALTVQDITKSSLKELAIYCAEEYKIRHNDMTGMLEFDGKVMDDKMVNKLRYELDINGRSLSKDKALMMLDGASYPSYHPIMDIINKVEDKEPVGHLEAYCKSIRTKQDSEYLYYFFLKWFVGLIVNSIEIECEPNVLMLCYLSEKQNIGKTRLHRDLLPKSLSKYYSEDFSRDPDSIEFKINMATHIFMMDDELDSMSKQDIVSLKNVLSQNHIHVTMKFKNFSTRMNRIATFGGTGNNLEIIKEQNNRRFIPIEVLSVDFDAINKVDRELMIVEAYNLHRDGYNYTLDKDDIDALNNGSDDYITPNSELEMLNEIYCKPKDKGTPISGSNVQAELKNKFKLSYSPKPEKIGRAFKEMGIKKQRKIIGKSKLTFYLVDVLEKSYN